MAIKVAVLGALRGNFAPFKKLAKIQSQQAFSLAIVCGDLFAAPSAEEGVQAEAGSDEVQKLLDGQIDIPLPTYFTIGRHALPAKVIERLSQNNDELCTNLFYLGKRSVFKTSEGVRIVALGGILNSEIIGSSAGSEEDKYTPFHIEQDANGLKGANNADILITSSWPQGVRNGSSVQLPADTSEPESEQCVANLAKALKPRYHFCASPDFFYEREPFFFRPSESAPDVKPITRFLSLASPDSVTKAKWLYAFNLDPTISAPMALPTNATPTPFLSPNSNGKRSLPADSYRYSNPDRDGYGSQHNGKRRRREKRAPRQDQCFFCLSNNPSTHLIASIGEDSYLTTSKGPVTTAASFEPYLQCPTHILIIPYAHCPTLASIPSSAGDDLERKNTYAEMVRYRRALNDMLRAKSDGQLGSVCWEINKQSGVHVHWQWMPLPIDTIRKGLVEAGLKVQAEGEGYGAFEKKEIGDGVDAEGDWFRIWVWEPPAAEGLEGKETPWLLPLDPTQRFDLQFGRRVMAQLLETPQRAHWKDVVQTEDEETKEKDVFQTAFKPWDFTDA